MRFAKQKKTSGLSATLVSALLTFLAVLLFPALALAQGGDSDPTALEMFYSESMKVLIPAFVTLIGSLAVWLGHKLRQKTSLEVSDKNIEAWSKIVKKAARRGAGWAKSKGKNYVDDQKLPGPAVLEVGATWAIETAKEMKLPKMGREKLKDLIEDELFDLAKSEEMEKAYKESLPKDPSVSS